MTLIVSGGLQVLFLTITVASLFEREVKMSILVPGARPFLENQLWIFEALYVSKHYTP